MNVDQSDFVLFDNNFQKLKSTDSIKISNNNDKLILYLVKSSLNENNNNKNNINSQLERNKELDENEVIMKCTGAKKPLKKRSFENFNRNRFNDFEFRENNRLNNLLNFLEELDPNIVFRFPVQNNNIQIRANENLLRQLQDMGFPEDRARQALINSRNNINRATELLLGYN